ncbi:hypothetical protein QZH41_008992 [Actinostola sp. cb2023]|nr:hypothetical protein QZH41_008992 [Actinostola sp. cb2023]
MTVDYRSVVRNTWMSIAMTLSIVGNLLLILVISRNGRFHNVTNAYNLSLSVSDLLKVVSFIPIYLVYADLKTWPFGLAGCQIFKLIFFSSFGVSILTLMCLSFERYHLIIKPTKKQLEALKKAKLIVETKTSAGELNNEPTDDVDVQIRPEDDVKVEERKMRSGGENRTIVLLVLFTAIPLSWDDSLKQNKPDRFLRTPRLVRFLRAQDLVLTVRQAVYFVAASWISSFLISCLTVPFLKLVPGEKGVLCTLSASKDWYIAIIIIMTVLSQVLPGIFFLVTHALTVRKLRRDAETVEPREQSLAARNRVRRNTRAIKILVIEAMSWVVCLAPYLVFTIIQVSKNGSSVKPFSWDYLIMNCALVAQTVVNPALHFILIREFRNELRIMWNSILKKLQVNQVEPGQNREHETEIAG